MLAERVVGHVIGIPIDILSWNQVIKRIIGWAIKRESRYVAVCNVHVTVSAVYNKKFGNVIKQADMSIPDGVPIAWKLRRLGFQNQPRISGPDLVLKLIDICARESIRVYFYGSTEKTLSKLHRRIKHSFPNLTIAGMMAPPFRSLSKYEDQAAVQQINKSLAGIIFVGLGCPKQEQWMADHRGHIDGVMIGVGAAFDILAGTQRRAPEWIQKVGLEWFHRLLNEPQRLWRRYLLTNSRFLFLTIIDFFKFRKH